jgi:hypothetical protein
LIEFLRWRLIRGGFLLRLFFDAITATAAGCDPAIGEEFLAFVQSDAAAHPVNVVADTIGDEGSACEREPDYASVIVVEARIVRGDDGIVLGDPPQLFSDLRTRRGPNSDCRSRDAGKR